MRRCACAGRRRACAGWRAGAPGPRRRRRWRRRWRRARRAPPRRNRCAWRRCAASRASPRWCTARGIRAGGRSAGCRRPRRAGDGRRGLPRRRRAPSAALRSIARSAWRKRRHLRPCRALGGERGGLGLERTPHLADAQHVVDRIDQAQLERQCLAGRRRGDEHARALARAQQAARACSWWTASRTTVRETPCASARRCSVGRRSPGRRRPAPMSLPSRSASRSERRSAMSGATATGGDRGAGGGAGAGQHGDRVIIRIRTSSIYRFALMAAGRRACRYFAQPRRG